MSTASQRLRELGLELPPAPQPVAVYTTAVRVGEQLWLSGHLPLRPEGAVVAGKLGEELDVEAGREAARRAALGLLATLEAAVGLDHVAAVLRLDCLVACGDSFFQHSQVANGASELLVQVFGEAGVHTRTAAGVTSLPLNAAVEISAVVALK